MYCVKSNEGSHLRSNVSLVGKDVELNDDGIQHEL